jgi:Tn3 transposase DDE domain
LQPSDTAYPRFKSRPSETELERFYTPTENERTFQRGCDRHHQYRYRSPGKNKLYYAFRELGRVVRTAFLLDYMSNQELRQIIQAAQNKCEGFNKFAQWAFFGADTIQDNVRDNQLKIIKYNHLIANLLIFHNCRTITLALKELETKGVRLTPELLGALSPYRTHHINRFGMYELREREPAPVDYGVTFAIGQPS